MAPNVPRNRGNVFRDTSNLVVHLARISAHAGQTFLQGPVRPSRCTMLEGIE